MKSFLIPFSILLALCSCKKQQATDDSIYFGGQISNPKSNFITLRKGELIIDTLFLNTEKKFLKKYTNLEEGLYTFLHGEELQCVYLEKRDSIIISLNTLDFDESLVFSGKGFEKNEYLINLFLENEKDEKEIHKYYRLSSQEFKDKIILLKELKLATFEDFISEQKKLTEAYKKIITSTINYHLFKKLEYYPLAHKKVTKSATYPELDINFYEYRKETNINDKTLVGYHVYTNYVINFLYNNAFSQLTKDNKEKRFLRLYFLEAVDEHIKIESFKNHLLMGNVLHSLLKKNNTNDYKHLELFLKLSTDKEDKQQVRKLIADKKTLPKNHAIPNFKIVSSSGDTTNIKSLTSNKKSVIYFWSHKYMSFDYINSRITYLKKKHPSVVFIGINLDSKTIDEANKNRFPKHYYQLPILSTARKYNSSGYPRTIIVSENGKIASSYANINYRGFSKNLREIEKN